MATFLAWVNDDDGTHPVLRAAKAHFWFVTIHPFDDGNGRIARAISNMLMSRSENRAQRFYSLSAQIPKERKAYFNILEDAQRGTLAITEPLAWLIDYLAGPWTASTHWCRKPC